MTKPTNTSTFANFVRSTASKLNPFTQSMPIAPAVDTAPYQPPQDKAVQEPTGPVMAQELGISQEVFWTRFEIYQYNPDELITKKGYRILEKMATSDDMISSCLTSLKIQRLAPGYKLVEASDDPLDVQIAEEVADNFDSMQGSLYEKLYSIMGSLDIGWSLHEKVWERWEQGPYTGHWRLKSLKAKNPQWFNPAVDDFNNITGIVMISPPRYGGKLPASKFLTYSAQKRYENVGGTSRIRTLYDWWYLKGIARAGLSILGKKYGKETPIMAYPPTMSTADKAAGLTALQNLATSAAISMPDGIKISFAKMDFQTVNGLLAIIEKADQQIAKVILGQVSSSGTSSGQSHKGGSQQGGSTGGGHGQAGGQAQAKTLDMYLQFIGNDIANNPMAELIKDIVDANYLGVLKYPKFEFRPIEEADMTQAVEVWDSLVKDGVVNSTSDDEEHIREILGFPSLNGKTTLRPNRFKNAAKLRISPPHSPILPAQIPIAGYRPPTPSAPGLPANYAERNVRGCNHGPTAFSEGFKPARALTKYEHHTDFAEALATMEKDGAQPIAADAADVLHKAVNKIKVDCKNILGDSTAIRKLTLPYRAELAGVLRDGLQSVAKKSMRQAKAEITAKKDAAKFAEPNKAHLDYGHMEPKEVMQLIQDRAFSMAGDISADVLKKIQQVMYAGVKSGASYKDIVYDIENQIAPYLDLTDTTGDLSGARLMTAVRTNVSSAFNDARDSIFLDPDLDGFVLAFQFSAILDSGTTPWCAGMDGKIFKVTNPIWDDWNCPTFYNCRSIKIPITKVDGWDGVESEEPKEQPPEW